MLIINTIKQMREFTMLHNTKSIGFVPTMGYLHNGHLSLIEEAKRTTDTVIVSIFVNPLQFGPNEDLDKYPTDITNDTELCKKAGVDVLFIPPINEMYANGYPPNTTVNIVNLDKYLCGAKRQGHFDGVCTIVCKLFNIVQPKKAFFGRKDIQQLRIIETMVADLILPVEIIPCETIRDIDGLALSSRNSYLSPNERQDALVVPKLLNLVLEQIKSGETNASKILDNAKAYLATINSAKLDYLEIVDYDNLQLQEIIYGKVVIATAIYIGKTRLIDNIIYNTNENKYAS